ncbi:hypothetical protein BDP81DRAFT_412213, partial [Colletotrichum phormii]
MSSWLPWLPLIWSLGSIAGELPTDVRYEVQSSKNRELQACSRSWKKDDEDDSARVANDLVSTRPAPTQLLRRNYGVRVGTVGKRQVHMHGNDKREGRGIFIVLFGVTQGNLKASSAATAVCNWLLGVRREERGTAPSKV